jgi:hypothetical protein
LVKSGKIAFLPTFTQDWFSGKKVLLSFSVDHQENPKSDEKKILKFSIFWETRFPNFDHFLPGQVRT